MNKSYERVCYFGGTKDNTLTYAVKQVKYINIL